MKFEPMNPAPPVTRIGEFEIGSSLWADLSVYDSTAGEQAGMKVSTTKGTKTH
jgi:hypothetical protein